MKLYKRDSKGKIRVCELTIIKVGINQHIINKTGLLGGTLIEHAPTIITIGKAGRTLIEQTNRELNSIVRKKKDRGYKTLADLGLQHSTNIEKDLEELFPMNATDANGFYKPMSAQTYTEAKAQKILDECGYMYVSIKVDGVRSTRQKDRFYSKEGKDYSVATTYINEKLDTLDLPNLDGEIYIHNKPLDYFSGKVRKTTLDPIHKELEYRVFDLMIDAPYEERLKKLIELSVPLSSVGVSIISAIKVYNIDELELLHEQAIKDGYEGLIIRSPKGIYNYGRRDKGLLKYKSFKDGEFEIVDKEEGKRGAMDMKFICKHKNTTFKVRPKGTNERREELFKEDNIGKLLTVRYFGINKNNKPIQPRGITIRDYE